MRCGSLFIGCCPTANFRLCRLCQWPQIVEDTFEVPTLECPARIVLNTLDNFWLVSPQGLWGLIWIPDLSRPRLFRSVASLHEFRKDPGSEAVSFLQGAFRGASSCAQGWLLALLGVLGSWDGRERGEHPSHYGITSARKLFLISFGVPDLAGIFFPRKPRG